MRSYIAKSHYSRRELRTLAREVAVIYGLNPDLFVAQIHHESHFNPHAHSGAGALGVAQITRPTARAWHVNPRDPVASLNAAARNMAGYVRTYQRQGHDRQTAERLALAAYNAGPHAVKKYKRIPPYRETQSYVRTIVAEAGQ